MQHYAAFYLGLHYLQKYYGVSQIKIKEALFNVAYLKQTTVAL